METLSQIKETIKKAIAEGLETGLKFIESLLDKESALFNVFVEFKRSFADAMLDFDRGLIDTAKKKEIESQVTHGLIYGIVEKLELDDIIASRRPAGDKKASRRIIPPFNLKFPKYKLDVLRLDRTDTAALFKQRFMELKEPKVQHYFVYAERHQQPRSFVERMIFEVETNPNLILYEPEGDKHIFVKELDLGNNLEIARLNFCEYFSGRFGGNVASLHQVEPAFAPGDYYPFVATVIRLHVDDWRPHTEDFLKWLFNDFCRTDPAIPTHFLFFFIVQKDTARNTAGLPFFRFLTGKNNPAKKAEAVLDAVRHMPWCTVFPELKPILVRDLIKWLGDFISNETAIDTLLRDILGSEKHGEAFDMSLVESQLVTYLQQKQSLVVG